MTPLSSSSHLPRYQRLSIKNEFFERFIQKQANQAEIKEGFSFLDKETYEALPLTRWPDKSGHPMPGDLELPVEKAAVIKILSKKESVLLDLFLRLKQFQQEFSRLNINSLSLLDKTMQATPEVMRILGGLSEREVTRDDPEWAAAIASLTVSEKVLIKLSRRQHKEIDRVCKTVVQQLVSSILQSVQEKGIGGRDSEEVFFGAPDQGLIKAESKNLEQENLSG